MARARRVEKGPRTEQMRNAMEAVMSGELGVNRSALQHGVPMTTLKDRIASRVQHGTKPGPVAYLDDKDLVKFVELSFVKSTAEFHYYILFEY